ncbi:MAG: tetratricopeptide repeat protein [Anaerolineales bacterium]|nr:tetratricopeptide repeat protein [Anaerolineales bacterium]
MTATRPLSPLPLDARAHLDRLVGLRMLRTRGDDEYAFHHALMHQAVYATLLRRERRQLHRAVAQTLVTLYDGTAQFNHYLGDLAYHYAQAEEWAEARQYAQAAGDEALARYAPHEALEHYTRAIEAAEALDQPVAPELCRRRGRAHETLGNFAGAEGDYAAALNLAAANRRPRAEWQALLDLGLLWSGRDYERAGEYFERALALARRFGQGAQLAHSLNRVGNWHLNQGQASAAIERHREALGIFQDLADDAGQAETYDLLGMTSYLGGDLRQGTRYLEQAVTLFRERDDRAGLASALTSLALRCSNPTSDTLMPQVPLAVGLRELEEALAVARGMHNRPGEAFALAVQAMCLASAGQYRRALAVGHAALALAEGIGHAQWQTCARCSLGAAYFALGADAAAADQLTRARALADEIASIYWQQTSAAALARVCARQGRLAEAVRLLEFAFDPAVPPRAMGRRSVWAARVELALAEGQAAAALDWLNTLAAALPEPDTPTSAIPRLALLRAQALTALGRSAEALTLLEATRSVVAARGGSLDEAQLLLALSRLQAHHRRPEAAANLAQARVTLTALAADLPNPALRAAFEAQTAHWLAEAAAPLDL